MTTVPIPLANPYTTTGTDSAGGGWLSDLGSWLDGTFDDVLAAGKSLVGNYFDYQKTTTQLEAQQMASRSAQQQAAYLAWLQAGGIGSAPNGGAQVAAAATGSSLPAWALPVGIVVLGGFATIMMMKR